MIISRDAQYIDPYDAQEVSLDGIFTGPSGMKRLTQFGKNLPLAEWNPSALQITSSDQNVRAGGKAGQDGGLFMVWINNCLSSNQKPGLAKRGTWFHFYLKFHLPLLYLCRPESILH